MVQNSLNDLKASDRLNCLKLTCCVIYSNSRLEPCKNPNNCQILHSFYRDLDPLAVCDKSKGLLESSQNLILQWRWICFVCFYPPCYFIAKMHICKKYKITRDWAEIYSSSSACGMIVTCCTGGLHFPFHVWKIFINYILRCAWTKLFSVERSLKKE